MKPLKGECMNRKTMFNVEPISSIIERIKVFSAGVLEIAELIEKRIESKNSLTAQDVKNIVRFINVVEAQSQEFGLEDLLEELKDNFLSELELEIDCKLDRKLEFEPLLERLVKLEFEQKRYIESCLKTASTLNSDTFICDLKKLRKVLYITCSNGIDLKKDEFLILRGSKENIVEELSSSDFIYIGEYRLDLVRKDLPIEKIEKLIGKDFRVKELAGADNLDIDFKDFRVKELAGEDNLNVNFKDFRVKELAGEDNLNVNFKDPRVKELAGEDNLNVNFKDPRVKELAGEDNLEFNFNQVLSATSKVKAADRSVKNKQKKKI